MSLYVQIKKKLGKFQLDVEFTMEKGVFAILGASGCGKSMTLKCIAGIEKPDRGIIRQDGRVLFDSTAKINVPARLRNVGYLFQDYALFPNMTVRKNILCAMSSKDEKLFKELCERFFISELTEHYPWQLSGGQKQRVALARMFAANPETVLLDEPFSALDSFLKWQLEQELLSVFESYDKPFLYVSHDRNEVYRLADNIAVMEKGSIVETAPKEMLFKHPKTLASTILTGCKNFTHVDKIEDYVLYAGDWGVRIKCDEKITENIRCAGYRAHYFTVTDTMQEYNCMECEILKVIKDTFSVILVLKGKDVNVNSEWSVIRYELPYDEWENVQKNEKLYLLIDVNKLIMLEK